MDENFKLKLYDSINTIAVRWLTYQQRINAKPIGIFNFSSKNIYHMWFLHMLESYRVFNDYAEYYIDCGFFEYLYIRYIKKFKGARRKKKDYVMIKVDIFIDELIGSFKAGVPDIKSSIIKEIYKEYWGK